MSGEKESQDGKNFVKSGERFRHQQRKRVTCWKKFNKSGERFRHMKEKDFQMGRLKKKVGMSGERFRHMKEKICHEWRKRVT